MKTICDTHALIWWCLQPDKLGAASYRHIRSALDHDTLMFCDISYWEIAMLLKKGRFSVSVRTPSTCCLHSMDVTSLSRVRRA